MLGFVVDKALGSQRQPFVPTLHEAVVGDDGGLAIPTETC